MKAEALAFLRFACPDLGVMRDFLEDFGLRAAASDERRLWMRAADAAPFVHMTELGPPGFLGCGFTLPDLNALAAVARESGSAAAPVEGPGGGRRVRLYDPDGIAVDLVAGQEPAIADSVIPRDWNLAGASRRANETRRPRSGPSRVVRLGHVVLAVRSLEESTAWYQRVLGLKISDTIQGDDGVPLVHFMRLDRGEHPTDHHTLALGQSPTGEAGYHHGSFEVVDFDDLMAGHEHLRGKGRKHTWGIGRHVAGSQIFDYWADPWGHKIEHWTDGDRFDSSVAAQQLGLEEMLKVHWGPAPPDDFGAASPLAVGAA